MPTPQSAHSETLAEHEIMPSPDSALGEDISEARAKRPQNARELAHMEPLPWPEGGWALVVPPGSPEKGHVLFLHGWVMNRTAWAEAAFPLIEEGYGLVLPDLPGHGDAEALPDPIGPTDHFDGMARRILLGLDLLNVKTVHVAGYSMGATTTLALLNRAPNRFEKAFLLDPIYRFPLYQTAFNPPRLHGRLAWNIARALVGPKAAELRRAVLGLFPHGLPFPTQWRRTIRNGLAGGKLPDSGQFGTYFDMETLCDVETFLEGLVRTDFRETARWFSGSFANRYPDVLEDFPGDLLVATGVHDALSPAAFCKRVAARHPRGRFELIEDADHVVLSQNPKAVTRLLLSWLDEPV
jgi:pimeloyl-ACP methyl ester carboxylesterase